MKQIKASEVKPGMTIQWDQGGAKIQMPVYDVYAGLQMVSFTSSTKAQWRVRARTPVTVLAEPQPEEPTEFGAKVIVKGRRFLRAPEGKNDDQPWLEENEGAWYEWAALCEMGPVQVVPDQGWTVPEQATDTPEVPERIEEWPEDDTALRPYKWMNEYGEIWRYGRNSYVEGWTSGYLFQNSPVYGPWDRVTDA